MPKHTFVAASVLFGQAGRHYILCLVRLQAQDIARTDPKYSGNRTATGQVAAVRFWLRGFPWQKQVGRCKASRISRLRR